MNKIYKVLALSLIVSLTVLAGPTLAKAAKASKAKIGIATTTVSQAEDAYRAAQQIAAKYSGRVLHVTHPDNFMQEQETTISNIESLASDPDVKAIIVGEAVPGTVAAFRKIKRRRNDIIFIAYQPQEDPDQVSREADIVFDIDNITRGKTIPRLAKKMGAKKFLHYSFPRHMSYKLLADRRDMMREEAKKLGIEFIFATAPDPLGEGGVPAAQQFILEDVGRKIKAHGKDTAFFCTNDAMTEPLIKRVAENKAIFAEPDVPSPTMGFPGAFGIKIPADKAGDYDYINKQIKKAVAKHGNSGRMATWPRPVAIVTMPAVADYVFGLLDSGKDVKTIKKKDIKDKKALEKSLSDVAGVKVTLTPYGKTDNYMLVLMDNIIY